MDLLVLRRNSLAGRGHRVRAVACVACGRRLGGRVGACPSPVPKNAWRWVETARYKLTRRAQHRAAGAIDLLVCATAVQHGHTVLHVDNDFATVAAVLQEVRQRDVRD